MATKIVQFRETVAAATRNVYRDNSPLTGKITRILTHFPPGSSALVQIALFVKGLRVLPKEGYIALDDTTPTFDVDIPVELGDPIELDIQNTDGVFSHTITVTITCEGEVSASVV